MTASITDHSRIDRYIPWMFVAFFAVIAIVDAVFVTVAIKTHTGVVTERAYEKGLDYNRTLALAAQSEALGWKTKAVYDNGILSVRIVHEGADVKGAKVIAYVTRPVASGHDARVPLIENASGAYEASVPLPLSGLWQIRVVADRGDTHYQGVDTFEAP